MEINAAALESAHHQPMPSRQPQEIGHARLQLALFIKASVCTNLSRSRLAKGNPCGR